MKLFSKFVYQHIYQPVPFLPTNRVSVCNYTNPINAKFDIPPNFQHDFSTPTHLRTPQRRYGFHQLAQSTSQRCSTIQLALRTTQTNHRSAVRHRTWPFANPCIPAGSPFIDFVGECISTAKMKSRWLKYAARVYSN